MKKVIKKRSLEERKLFFARNLYKVKLEPSPKKVEPIREVEKEEPKKSETTTPSSSTKKK